MNPGGMRVVFFIGKGKEKDCVSLLQAATSGEKAERVGRGQSVGVQVKGPPGRLSRCQGLI